MRSATAPVRRCPSPLRRRRTFADLAVTISYREVGVEADLVASEVDFIEQIAGGGEWGVAAQDDGVEWI